MSQPLRILHVLGGMGRGGAETMVMNLYRAIDRSQIQFDFVVHTGRKRDYDDEIKTLGGNIYRVPRYTGKNHFEYKKAWHDFFKKHSNYSIIHGHVRSTASIYLKVAKKYGLATIAHSHNTSSGHGLSALAKNILQLPLRSISDYFFSCSLNAGEWLFGKKVCKQDNFFLLNNAINTDEFIFNIDLREKIRNKYGLEGKFVIGHIGRFHYQKNHSFLIDIFKEVSAQDPSAILVLIGTGDLEEKVKQKVIESGLKDKVIFTGSISNVHELLQGFDMFLFPSFFEGLPVTLVEVQAAGLYCLASDTITEEVKLTELFEYFSLDKNAQDWAERILEEKEKLYRVNTLKEITDSGYDIKSSAKWYQEFCLSLE